MKTWLISNPLFGANTQQDLSVMQQWHDCVSKDDAVIVVGAVCYHKYQGRFEDFGIFNLPGHKSWLMSPWKEQNKRTDPSVFSGVVEADKYIPVAIQYGHKNLRFMVTTVPAEGHIPVKDKELIPLHVKFRKLMFNKRLRFVGNFHSYSRNTFRNTRHTVKIPYNRLVLVDELAEKLYIE